MTPARRKANTAINKPVMEKCCKGLEVEIEEFNSNSFRLPKGGFTKLDYFPGTNRAMIHQRNKMSEMWIDVVNLIEFLCECFNDDIGTLIKPKIN